MNLFSFISKLKKKTVEPKVYHFLLENSGYKRICLKIGYDFLEVLKEEKISFAEMIKKMTNKEVLLGDIQCNLWNNYTVSDLFEGFLDNSIEPIKDVNTLLREIDSKKTEFKETDKKLIKELLKI